MSGKYKGLRTGGGRRRTSDIGYVIIPANVDREEYVAQCYRTGTVSVMNEGAEVIHRVKVGRLTMQLIEFPEKIAQMGSMVVYVSIPKHNFPIIVDVFDKGDQVTDASEYSYSVTKNHKENQVSVSLDAVSGSIDINAKGSDDVEININLISESKNAKFKVYSQGSVAVKSESEVTVEAKSKASLSVGKSTKIEATEKEVRVNADKVIHNDGESNMVLGDVAEEFLNKIIDQISAITVTTSLGTMPILNKIQVTALKKDTKTILSNKSFLK